VLLLDEPTANLDPISTSKIEEVLAHIIREQKTTVVMATHNMSQGQRLAGSARNTFEGRIAKIFSVGALVRVEAACGFPLLAVVTKRSAEDLNLAVDKKVYAAFKATAVHVIKRWN
jgi:molybdopterin-binding protein